MILKECFVSSFGKLKDFKYNFNDKINVINQENGFGKTTLSVFIKSMFYGLNDSKRDVGNNERKKYKPWNSLEKFGGYITFEKGGCSYKIERFFGNKEAEDTCILTNLDTGKTYDNAFDLGKRLFEIDEEGFYSTTFFSQKDISVKSNTSLTEKFNEVCEVEDSLSFDKALQKVNVRLKEYKYSGDRGLIPDTKRKINQVEIELDSLSHSVSQLEDLRKQEVILNDNISSIKKQISKLTEKISVRAQEQSYRDNKKLFDKLSAENDEISNKISSIKASLNNNLVTNEELNVCQDSISQLNALAYQKDVVEQDIELLKSQSLTKNSSSSNYKAVTLILSLIVLAVGISCFFINLIPAIIFTILGLGLLTFGLVNYKPKGSRVDHSAETLLEKKNIQNNEITSCIEDYKNSLERFFLRFNLKSTDYFSRLDELREAVSLLADYEKILLRNRETLNGLNVQPKLNELENEGEDLSLLYKALRETNIQLQESLKEHSNLLSLIKNKEEESNNVTFLENKLEELTITLKQQQEEFEILKLTSNYLQKAQENLKIRYRAPIQNALDKYLKVIANNKVNASIDVDLNLSVHEQALSVQPEYFSQGYRNIFEICKRFALIEVLFSKEKPFIILDDPFSNLDQEKITKSLEVLNELSKEYQIIYFTCHHSRAVVGD